MVEINIFFKRNPIQVIIEMVLQNHMTFVRVSPVCVLTMRINLLNKIMFNVFCDRCYSYRYH